MLVRGRPAIINRTTKQGGTTVSNRPSIGTVFLLSKNHVSEDIADGTHWHIVVVKAVNFDA
jgi:hypothetical protein